jgi:vacuolar-type H+-ATPase subunit I/STV1
MDPTAASRPDPSKAVASVPAAGDWPAQAADLIVNTVGTVRDRTTGTILSIARITVFGLLAVVLGLVVVVLSLIGLIRLLDVILPSSVWLPYLIVGSISLGGGILVFRRRIPPTSPGNTSRR